MSGRFDRFDTYAVVTCGHINAKVERFCYWHPKDDQPLDVVFEATIDGLPEHCGIADVHTNQAWILHDLAAVSVQVAALLEEAKTRPDLVRGFFLNPA